MKLCKDCKHYKADEWSNLDSCTHPLIVPPVNPVRGNALKVYCDEQRMAGKPCGHEGKMWAAK